MANIEKTNFIKEQLKSNPKVTTRVIQAALKAKFGKGVKNTFISEVKQSMEKKEGTKKGNKDKKKESKKVTKIPGPPKDPIILDPKAPSNGDLIDAFIHLQDIRRKFPAAYEAWSVKYPAEIKRYIRWKYPNYAAFTEVVNDFFENIKSILEVTKKNGN